MAKESLKDRLRKEAARLKEQEESRGGQFEKIDMLKPEVGDNIIRILPNQKNPDGDFFKRIAVHQLPIEKKDGTTVEVPVRCLADFDEDCPLCAENERLFKKGDKDGAKKLRAQEKWLYLVLDYKKKAILPWSVGVTIHTQIMEFCMDLDAPLNHDWKLVKKYDPKKGKIFGTSYSIRPNMKESEMPSKLAALIEEATDLDSVYASNERTKMNDFLGIENEEAEEAEEPKAKSKSSSKPEVKTKAKAKPEPEDEDEDDRSGGFEDEASEDDELPEDKYAKSKMAGKSAASQKIADAKAKAATSKKKTVQDEEPEDEDDLGGFESEDEDLEAELKRMGVD
jgi:hypothetical protein